MKTYTYDAIVIGSGAAGYNAALRIKESGKKSVAVITEGENIGTSRNTGSDKQTYYKLGLSGDSPDSVLKMAENLFSGGSVDGDNALCEAALSVRSFMNLCELGVEFPVNRYGEYIGYKTDHDPYERATSAGPLTSKFMTEALQKRCFELKVDIFSGYLAIEILKNNDTACGVLCVDIESGESVAFRCADIILATGGPAGIYADSVYPACHTGSSSLAIMCGAKMQNLTEWQFGLASVNPRWNVSGTYMQVLPRFVSVDKDGNEYEFLADYFTDKYEALSNVFLKGYQWPFDSKKVLSGSSVIDILVYRECVFFGRKVYLDFTKNPFGFEKMEYQKLSDEAYQYLLKADACFGKPIDRLLKMNAPAIELYKEKGIDIRKEYLEIALCAQHHNGGIAVDMWWQTSIKGLFAVGECAGTHGVARPGGSALNAGQVGSLRAAQYISQNGNKFLAESLFENIVKKAKKSYDEILNKILNENDNDNVAELIALAQRKMSDNAAAIRNKDKMTQLLKDVEARINSLINTACISDKKSVFLFYKLRDILITQRAVLCAMIDYSENVTDTRGSALYFDESGDLREGLEETFRFACKKNESYTKIQEVSFENTKVKVNWRDVRPIPKNDNFFENVWKTYRENKNIF